MAAVGYFHNVTNTLEAHDLCGVPQNERMFKVSLVGHSQLPTFLQVEQTEIRIFRAPGSRASTFFNDQRLNQVLQWKHDHCILWLGSNDIVEGMSPGELFHNIKEITRAIENECGAVVQICLIEPRIYPNSPNAPITSENYKKVMHSINKRIKRSMRHTTINFNTISYVQELARDGVHFREGGKERIKEKLTAAINYVKV